jgi:hypothetical protein
LEVPFFEENGTWQQRFPYSNPDLVLMLDIFPSH